LRNLVSVVYLILWWNVGVIGTPTFFVNGRKFTGAFSYENFEKIIQEELTAKK